MSVTSRKSFLSPRGVAFDFWITCGICHLNHSSMKSWIWEILFNGPWDTGFIFSLEKHNQGEKKSESLNPISPSADAPTVATPQVTPNPSAPCIHPQHRAWKSVVGKAAVRNLNYYSKPSNSEIPAARCDTVQGGRRQHTGCEMIHCNTKVQKVLGFPISKWE